MSFRVFPSFVFVWDGEPGTWCTCLNIWAPFGSAMIPSIVASSCFLASGGVHVQQQQLFDYMAERAPKRCLNKHWAAVTVGLVYNLKLETKDSKAILSMPSIIFLFHVYVPTS